MDSNRTPDQLEVMEGKWEMGWKGRARTTQKDHRAELGRAGLGGESDRLLSLRHRDAGRFDAQ